MSNLKGIEISDIIGLKQPLLKLVECVSCGIGKIYDPIHIKRMAKAKSQELEIIGETISKNIDLPTKYSDGEIFIDTTSAEELIKRTGSRLIYQEARKQQNIESIIAGAYNDLEKDEQISDEPVNEDWLFKFFEFAGNISNEEMQQIWSKILVGEIKRPSTYSLRTLDILKNMTQEEAMLFQKISKFKFMYNKKIPFIIKEPEILEKYGCNYSDLLRLQDCGLMNLNSFVNLASNEEEQCIYNDKIYALIKGKVGLSIYNFTESGKQLLNLIKDDTNFNYSLDAIKSLKNEINVIKTYKMILMDGVGLEYDDTKDLLEEIY